jgi:fibronectin-binding autotransporter adhesin
MINTAFASPTKKCFTLRFLQIGFAGAALAIAASTPSSANAAPTTWVGATTSNWNSASNWSGNVVPLITDDLTIFGPGNAAAALTINFDASNSANSINITDTAAVTISNTTSGANQTLTIGAGGLTTAGGAVTIGANTANQNIPIALGASQTWNIGSGGANVINGASGTGFSLAKTGTGTLTLSGNNSFNGGIIVNGGILQTGQAVAATFAQQSVSMGGGTFFLSTPSIGATKTYTFNGLALTAGSNQINALRNTTGSPIVVDFGGSGTSLITRTPGSTAFFSLSATATMKTATANTGTSILGGWATIAVNTGGAITAAPTDWAVSAGTGAATGNITALPTASYTVSNAAATAPGATANVDFTASNTTAWNTQSMNSLRFNTLGAATLSLASGQTLTNTTGGILVTATVANNPTLITGGNLAGAAGGELFIHQWNTANGLTIASAIVDNGSATALVKSGTGLLTLSNASNGYTGKTYLNGGITNIVADASLGVAPASPVVNQLNLDGGTLQFASAFNLSNNRGITVVNGGGTLDVQAFSSSYGGSISGNSIFSKAGTGTLTLIGPSTFTGGTIINDSAGILSITHGAALGSGPIQIGQGASDRVEELQISNNITVANPTVNVAGKNSLTNPTVENLSGNNTITSNVNFALAGGTNINLISTAGSATFAGNVTATGVTGARTIHMGGAGNGAISGIISNGTATVGLLKDGAGSWSLSGNNTATGTVSVTTGSLQLGGSNQFTGTANVSGTLQLSGAGAINSTSGITVNGNGAKFIQTSSVPSTPAITVTNGGVDGAGSVGSTTVASGASNFIANGNGTTGALTLSSLSFSGLGAVNANIIGGVNTSAPIIVTGNLGTPFSSAGAVAFNGTTANALVNGTTYNLISYGTFSGTLADFAKGASFMGLSARQVTFLDTGSAIAFKYSSTADTVTWTGLDDNTWNAGLTGVNKNWKLTTAGTATDFLSGDDVVFTDAGANTNPINVAGTVTISSALFTNSAAKPYSFTGVGSIAGPGAVAKSGTGTLTLGTTNSYAGGTNLSAGQLNINNSTALGTGALTITGGTLDNTSGSAIFMSNNNAQNWNSDVTFLGAIDGTHDLNMGTGTVTLSGATRTVTVNAGQFGVGGLSGATTALIVQGAGTLGIGNSTIAGLSGSGNIANNLVLSTLTVNQAGNSTFSGTLNGLLTLTKTGTGVLTLSGVNSYTSGTNLNGGTIVATNSQSLGSGIIQFQANSTGTLDLAMDPGTDIFNNWGTNTTSNITLAVNRATPGVGSAHSLGSSLLGGGTIAIVRGSNVTGGSAMLTLGGVSLTAGSTQTTTFNPTTSDVTLAAVTNGSNNIHTFEMGGTSSANLIQSGITSPTGTLNVLKSSTSTWTLTGNSTVNGTTTLSGGILNLGDSVSDASYSGGALTNNAVLNLKPGNAATVATAMSGTGALNQMGPGSTTLSGNSPSFTGPTTVTGGKLIVTGTLTGSALSVTSGGLDGTGSVSTTTIADNTTNTIANGNGATGALTLSALTFQGDATVNVRRTNAAGLLVTGALTMTPANGTVIINLTTTTGIWSDGLNNLINFGSFGGSISNFTLGTLTRTLGPRQSYGGLVLNGNNIALQVNGDSPKWTGALNGVWSTANLVAPKNWKLIASGATTDYIDADSVRFDDSATGTTSINISAGTVNPTSTTFANSAKNYTIASSGGFGIGGGGFLVKNGTGNVTISTNNSYAGTTTVNAGTLALTGSNSGTSGAVVNGGTLRLDFTAATAPTSNIINGSATLTLGGGELNLVGKPGTSNSQTFASTALNAGGSSVTLTGDHDTSPIVLNLGTITKNPAGTVVFTLPSPISNQDFSNGVTASNSNDATGIIGPWAIINSPNVASINAPDGYTYAASNGSNLVPYIGATPLTGTGTWGGMPSGGTGTINYDVNVTGTGAGAGNARNVNTIRYTGPGFTQGGTTLTINGLMNAGTGALNLSQTLAIGATNELVVAAATAPINLSGVIGNNGTNTSRLTIVGPNVVNISGVNTYTGSTNVNSGTLRISGAGSVETSSGFNINGNNAKLAYSSSVVSTRNIALTNGTLDGTGSVGAVTMASDTGATVTNGDGGTSPLTVSSLTFQGSANANINYGGTAGLIVTGALTTSPSNGQVTLTPAGVLTSGTNNLISFGTLSGSINDFTLGANAAVSARAGKTLLLNGNNIALSIVSHPIAWSGGPDGLWTTAANNDNTAPNRWALVDTHAPTNFWIYDDVQFNDTVNINGTTSAPATTNVTIQGGVSPASVTFNNSTLPYTVSSSDVTGISGGTSIVKNGSGSVTLSTSNSYSGGTTLNAGTLNITVQDALGTGRITLNAGTLDNTSGVPLTLPANNPQTWGGNFTYGGTSELNLGTGAVTMTGSPTVTVNANKLTVGGVISGNALTKAGAGTLTLTALNAYTGGTTVNGGTLELGAGGGTGAIRGALTINGGTVRSLVTDVLGFNDGGQVTTLTVNAGGVFDAFAGGNQGFRTNVVLAGGTVQSTSTGRINFTDGFGISTTANSGNSTFSAPIQIRGVALTIDTAAGSTLALGGNIGSSSVGGGILNKAGTGTLLVNGGGTNTLNTINVNAGTFALGVTNAISTTAAGKISLNGGTLATGGFDQNFGGSLALSATSTLDLGAAASPASVVFANSAANGWTGTLNVQDWTFGTDHVYFNFDPAGLTATQLAQVKFAGFSQGASFSTDPLNLNELTPLFGDIDQNGAVNNGDIHAMLVALTNINQYSLSKSLDALQTQFILDINHDGLTTNADIQSLLALVANLGAGSVAGVPEPSSFVLIGSGVAIVAARSANRRKRLTVAETC